VIDRQFRIVVANEMFARTYGPWENRFCYAVYKGRSDRCQDCGALQTFADENVRIRQEQG
jgi:histidine kinase